MSKSRVTGDPIVWANQQRNHRVRWYLSRAVCSLVGHHWESQGTWRMCTRCAGSEWFPDVNGWPPHRVYDAAQLIEATRLACEGPVSPEEAEAAYREAVTQ